VAIATAVQRLKAESGAPEAKLATAMCKALEALSPAAIQKQMHAHLQRMNLVDAHGAWSVPGITLDLTGVTAEQPKLRARGTLQRLLVRWPRFLLSWKRSPTPTPMMRRH